MASREQRRISQKKKSGDKTYAERQRNRHPVFYWIAFFVLIVVVVAFIGSGVVGEIAPQDRPIFGAYGNNDIVLLRGGYSALNFFTEQVDTLGSQSDDPERAPYFWRQAFDNTLTHYTIVDIAQKSGYTVSKRQLDKGLASHREFQSAKGFDERKYRDASDMTKSMLKKLMSEVLIHSQYIEDVLFSQLISSSEVEFYKGMSGSERKFYYISYRYSDFPEENVIAYGNENAELFKEMRFSRILLTESSEKEAKEIRGQIENKLKSFEDIAREKSGDIYAEKGGDMGSQYYYQIKGFIANEEDVRHLYSLKKDELSNIIKNGDNFELYRCNSTATEPDFSDSTLLRNVRDYMMKYQKDVIENYSMELANTFKQKAVEAGFKQACTDLGMDSPYETEFFPINYLDIFPTKGIRAVSGEAPSLMSASGSEAFFVEVFSLEKEEISDPIRLDDQIVVLQLIEERTMTDEEWETENIIFKTSLSYSQNDFNMMQLMNSVYQVAVKHYQQPSYVYQFLFSKIMSLAEEKNIPYEYAFKVFLNMNSDMEKMLEDVKQAKAEDNFEDVYYKNFKSR